MLAETHLFILLVQPSWRIPHFRIDIFLCDGKVDEIKVEIVQPEIRQRSFCSFLDVFLGMETVPELAGNEKFLTFHQLTINGCFEAITDARFIAVVCCAWPPCQLCITEECECSGGCFYRRRAVLRL